MQCYLGCLAALLDTQIPLVSELMQAPRAMSRVSTQQRKPSCAAAEGAAAQTPFPWGTSQLYRSMFESEKGSRRHASAPGCELEEAWLRGSAFAPVACRAGLHGAGADEPPLAAWLQLCAPPGGRVDPRPAALNARHRILPAITARSKGLLYVSTEEGTLSSERLKC